MRYNAEGFLWKVACFWLVAFVREIVTAPLLGPDQMSFDSLSPFAVWQEPTFAGLPPVGNLVGPGVPTPTTGIAGVEQGPRTNIIRAPCRAGMVRDVTGCRTPFQFFRDDSRVYQGRRSGGPFPGRRTGRARFEPRPEPETPDPEKVSDDDDQ